MAKVEEYPVLVGQIQQFGDKEAITERDVEVDGDDVTVREFTIKVAGTQGGLVKITLWPQFDHVDVEAGDTVIVGGRFTSSKGKTQTFWQQSAQTISVIKAEQGEGKGKKKKPSRAKASDDTETDDGDEDPPF